MSTKASSDSIVCPDPSAHQKQDVLQNQASKAALYVTGSPGKSSNTRDIPVLGPDGKLSSAGAAASLKHAQPQDLPSFPVVGIDTATSGHQAANIANTNQKPFEHWKPDPTTSGHAAANIANSTHQPFEHWKPDPTSSGHAAANIASASHQNFEHWKPGLSASAGKAATAAHKDGGKVELWRPTASDAGHAAADAAIGKPVSQIGVYNQPEQNRKNSLLAATMSVSGRSKSVSPAPDPNRYPDASRSAANALSAATLANRSQSLRTLQGERTSAPTASSPRMSSAALEAARVQHTSQKVMPAEMYTYDPYVGPQVEEPKLSNEALRASAVSMTKSLEAQAREENAPKPDMRQEARNYLKVEETAQRLVQERLSKMDPDGLIAQREHYGYNSPNQRNRLSVRRKSPRESMDDDLSDDDSLKDEVRAGRIRHEMSIFNKQVEAVDAKKRQQDRQSLMAAAEKAVQERMRSMDKQLFEETGKVTPAMMREYEAKARERVAAAQEERNKKAGMTHIGGGKFMSAAEIDAIAAAKMQPTLDSINRDAERQHARDDTIRLDMEQRKMEAEREKEREKENEVILKQQKALEYSERKRAEDEAKEEQRKAKEEEDEKVRQYKEEQKQQEKEEKDYQKLEKRLQKEREKQWREEEKEHAQAIALEREQQSQERAQAMAREREQKSEEEKLRQIEVRKSYSVRESKYVTPGGEADEEEGEDESEDEREREIPPDSEATHEADQSAAVKQAQSEQTEEPLGVPTSFRDSAATGTSEASKERPGYSSVPKHTVVAEASPAEDKKGKRRSQIRGFFTSLRRPTKRDSSPPAISSPKPIVDDTDEPEKINDSKDVEDEEDVHNNGKGKGRASKSRSPSISSISSDEPAHVGRLRESEDEDEFDDAHDTIDAEEEKEKKPKKLGKLSSYLSKDKDISKEEATKEETPKEEAPASVTSKFTEQISP